MKNRRKRIRVDLFRASEEDRVRRLVADPAYHSTRYSAAVSRRSTAQKANSSSSASERIIIFSARIVRGQAEGIWTISADP
jgi:hypothetical protein